MQTAIINITQTHVYIEVARTISHLKQFVLLQVDTQAKLIKKSCDKNKIELSVIEFAPIYATY